MVFTKCGRRWESRDAGPQPNLYPASLRADCEGSLRRLGVDAVDLLQIHWPDPEGDVPVEESWGELLRLKDEGKTRYVGVCNFDEALVSHCESTGHVDSLQTPLSLISRTSARNLIGSAAACGTAVLVYSPLHIGLLTESDFDPPRIAGLSPEDWRRRHPDFLPPRLERNLALRDALRPFAAAHQSSVAAIAVAWTLAWAGVTAAIVGASTASQVTSWVTASSLTLSPRELEEISSAIESTGAGEGPTLPSPGS